MLRAALLSLVLACAASLPASAQCSMCKESLKEQSANQLSMGLAFSIIGMLSILAVMVGWIVIMILRSDRQAEERRRAAEVGRAAGAGGQQPA